jgi:methyl-accepting chemotaxis protein
MLVDGSEAVARRSREVATTSRETGVRVGSASKATDDLAQGLSRIAAAIEELSASVREVSRSCQQEAVAAGRADRDVASARENFQGLVVAVQETTRLLDGIQNISDQTQMLALNATIEAARAGEAGRGFAVVAASVKDLSRQALGTTREISEHIEAMGRAMVGADASISSLEEVVRSVRAESSSIAAAVEEQEATIAELSRSISETHQQSQSISADVRGASRGTDVAAQEIEAVSEGVAQAAREIVAVREGMQEIETLAADLKALVGRFRT